MAGGNFSGLLEELHESRDTRVVNIDTSICDLYFNDTGAGFRNYSVSVYGRDFNCIGQYIQKGLCNTGSVTAHGQRFPTRPSIYFDTGIFRLGIELVQANHLK